MIKLKRVTFLLSVSLIVGCNKSISDQKQSEQNFSDSTSKDSHIGERDTTNFTSLDKGTNLSAETSNLNVDMNISSDQLFDFDKSELTPNALPIIKELAERLKTKSKENVIITGYTDSKGEIGYNQKLSQDRAESIKSALLKLGVNNNISTVGKGEADPIAPNENTDGTDNPEGRTKNRRVVITFNGTQSISN